MKAIVMLSGGMDSAVTLALAVRKHGAEEILAVTFDYGQRHDREIKAALALVEHFGVGHKEVRIDLGQIGGSSLTDDRIEVPEFKEDEKVEVTSTYVPMRNTIFIALSAAIAEVIGAKYIYTGFNHIDSGGYPDTRPGYVMKMNDALALGSRDKPYVTAPLIEMTKADIVRKGEELGIPWEITWACYEGGEKPCGKCNACVQRAKGFNEARITDPLGTQVPDLAKTIRD